MVSLSVQEASALPPATSLTGSRRSSHNCRVHTWGMVGSFLPLHQTGFSQNSFAVVDKPPYLAVWEGDPTGAWAIFLLDRNQHCYRSLARACYFQQMEIYNTAATQSAIRSAADAMEDCVAGRVADLKGGRDPLSHPAHLSWSHHKVVPCSVFSPFLSLPLLSLAMWLPLLPMGRISHSCVLLTVRRLLPVLSLPVPLSIFHSH